jgi:hypothetical protein
VERAGRGLPMGGTVRNACAEVAGGFLPEQLG